MVNDDVIAGVKLLYEALLDILTDNEVDVPAFQRILSNKVLLREFMLDQSELYQIPEIQELSIDFSNKLSQHPMRDTLTSIYNEAFSNIIGEPNLNDLMFALEDAHIQNQEFETFVLALGSRLESLIDIITTEPFELTTLKRYLETDQEAQYQNMTLNNNLDMQRVIEDERISPLFQIYRDVFKAHPQNNSIQKLLENSADRKPVSQVVRFTETSNASSSTERIDKIFRLAKTPVDFIRVIIGGETEKRPSIIAATENISPHEWEKVSQYYQEKIDPNSQDSSTIQAYIQSKLPRAKTPEPIAQSPNLQVQADDSDSDTEAEKAAKGERRLGKMPRRDA